MSKRVLMDAATFDFPTSVTRSTDLSASTADTRTGHHVYAPLTPVEVERGRAVFAEEWDRALLDERWAPDAGAIRELRGHGPAPPTRGSSHLRGRARRPRPLGRATTSPTRVLAWIDALAPVIASPRAPRRWSRVRRAEHRDPGRP